jgi:hypothetical protein
MRLSSRARSLVLFTTLAICGSWTLAAPLVAKVLYPSPAKQPHGITKAVFYCHLQ